MANGNSELRAELRRLTLPPEGADLGWLDVQVREMEALNERIRHRVRIMHTRFSPPIYEVNCFMFTLGIEADAVSDMRLGPRRRPSTCRQKSADFDRRSQSLSDCRTSRVMGMRNSIGPLCGTGVRG